MRTLKQKIKLSYLEDKRIKPEEKLNSRELGITGKHNKSMNYFLEELGIW